MQLSPCDLTYAGMRAACQRAGLSTPPYNSSGSRQNWSDKSVAALVAALVVLHEVQPCDSLHTIVRSNLFKLHSHRRAKQHCEKAQVDSALQLHMLVSTKTAVCTTSHMLQPEASDSSHVATTCSHGWQLLCMQLLAQQMVVQAAKTIAAQQAAALDSSLAAAHMRIQELQRKECEECGRLQHCLNERQEELMQVVRACVLDRLTCACSVHLSAC